MFSNNNLVITGLPECWLLAKVLQSDLFSTFNELWAIFLSWQIGFFSAVFSQQKNEHMMYRLVHVYPWGCMFRYVTDSFFL